MYNDSGSYNLLSHRDSETTPFLQKFYTETSEKHIGFLPFFYSLVHLMRWKVVTKDKDMLPVLSLTWHKILLSSQKYFPPKHSKAISTSDRYGVQCATFRLGLDESENLFGTQCLSLLSDDDPLLWKLLCFKHAPPVAGRFSVHTNQIATSAAMQRGAFGISGRNIRDNVQQHERGCKSMYPGFDLTDIPARNDQSQLAALTASGIKIQSHIDTFINIRNNLFTYARKFGKAGLIEKGQLKGKTA